MNSSPPKFSMKTSSDLDYEKLVVDLDYGNSTVAILNCDNGDDKVEIYLKDEYSRDILSKFQFSEFINCLSYAYNITLNSNRNSNTIKNIISGPFNLGITTNLEHKSIEIKIIYEEILVALVSFTKEIDKFEIFIYKKNVYSPIRKLDFIQLMHYLTLSHKRLFEDNKEI